MEYAVLITDDWQKKELGYMLTEYCIEIAKIKGVTKLLAETTRDNKPMISVFRKLNFKIRFNEEGTVSVKKELNGETE
ncbi:MAG: GNAT family N-acetyltransferase [Spirochaetales bacterium]|nr:GNAT family N-acetyltransferase [Spirochaetales bacterium]